MSDVRAIKVDASPGGQGVEPYVAITGLTTLEQEMVTEWYAATPPQPDTPVGTPNGISIDMEGAARITFPEFTSPGAMVGYVRA